MGFEKNEVHSVTAGRRHSTDEPVTNNEEELRGPIENRECRDVTFLVIFMLFIGGLGYITWKAVSLGNPLRIVYGVDSWGNLCNQDNDAIHGVSENRTGLDLTSKKYLFYFNTEIIDNIIDDVSCKTNSIKICVTSCPSSGVYTVDQMKNLATTSGPSLCVYDVNVNDYFSGNSGGLSDCPSLPIEAHEEFLHRCIPASVSNRVSHLADIIDSLLDVVDENFLEKAASDLNNSWFEVLLLCGLALVVGILLTLLLQVLATIIVWVMVVAMVVGTITATVVCWYQYHKVKTEYDDTGENGRTEKQDRSVRDWLIGSICVTVITVVVILILLAVRKHVGLTSLILCGTFGTMVLIFLYIETAGKNKTDSSTGFVEYQLEDSMKYYKWYHIFAVIWIVQFILACHQIAIAGAVVTWFFTRYHLGSVAFGSLVITTVVLIRAVLSFIENRIRGKTHPIATFLLKCFKCCLWCFEKFLKFLNGNAYIEISIHGYNFCKAARQAFKVVLQNVIKMAVINYVGDFVLFLGKVATVAIVTIAGIELISSRTDINYVWLPTVIAAIFAYFISSCFMSVYEMTMDTIFLCFCKDSMMNDGVTRPYYMSVNLMRCLSAKPTSPKNKVLPASIET